MALLTQSFDGAQTFYVDPSSAAGGRTLDISSIDLYFKFKPDLNLNLTQQPDPSVSIFVTETMYGVPRVTRDSGIFTGNMATVFLRDVLTSTDATAPTLFRFPVPVTVETDKEYAFVIMYDLDSEFELWDSVQGEILTGTTTISPGSSNKFIGKFFGFTSLFVADDTNNLDEYVEKWRSVSDTSLKFNIRVARYAHGLVPINANGSIDDADIIRTNPTATAGSTSNTTNIGFNVNFGSFEFLSFNENISNKTAFVGGMLAFQNTVSYPGGYQNAGQHLALTAVAGNTTLTANTQLPDGSDFQWSNIFPTQTAQNYVVLTDGLKYNVRKVDTIVSNTVVLLEEPPSFSNTDTKMMITPVGRISSFNKESPFGIADAFLMVSNSSSNSTVRFVNNDIEAVAVTAGGTGYNNSDVFYVKGYEFVANKVEGGYVAVGNLVTNSSGGITTVYLSNLGSGFVNSAAMVAIVANSTQIGNTSANSTAGSGATFAYTVGATVKTEQANNTFRECKVLNLDIGEFIPYHNIEVPAGTDYDLKLETNYIKVNDSTTTDGFAYYVNDGTNNNQIQITLYDVNSTEPLFETPVLPSKSNEFNLKYQDTSVNDKVSNTQTESSQALRIVTDLKANSDYSIVRFGNPSIQFSKYIVNNDATNEHTDSGNAYAKGLTKIINFTRTTEDLRVFLTAYKPSNTDIKVYARIFKNEDPEAFDDKDWTLLELKDGTSIVSSSADNKDYIELTYGFYQVPPEENRTTTSGVVQIQNGNATVLGSNTLFQTELAVGDVFYAYQPLFRENHFLASVASIASNTSFDMDFTTTNTSIIAEGMKIEKVSPVNQAWNNIQNDNIVRYYNTSISKFDGYETLAVKIVFLSDSPHKIPRVDDIRAVGVSA
jgi:hypothetical protein